MKLDDYLKKNGIRRDVFAFKIGTSYAYLNMILTGVRNAGLPLAVKIERETNGAVKCADMLPEDET